ncbi:MAG: hypothetical protein ABR986_11850, partial [Methanomassiliicoccales archaeon]
MDEGSTEKDVKFETISAEKIPFGRNNFIEVARKKAITKEGENEFISLLTWIEGYPLGDLMGVFPLLAEEQQEASHEALALRWLRVMCEALDVL